MKTRFKKAMNIYVKEPVLKCLVYIKVLFLLAITPGCVHHIILIEPNSNAEIKSFDFNSICIQPPKEIKIDEKWNDLKYNKFLLKIKDEFPNQVFSCDKKDPGIRLIKIQVLIGDPKSFLYESGYDTAYAYLFLFTAGLVPYIRDFDVDAVVIGYEKSGEPLNINFDSKYRKFSHIFLLPVYPFIKSEEDRLVESTIKIIHNIVDSKNGQLITP